MKLTKQHILIGLLAASLLGNLFQVLHAHNERGYAQLGRNLVATEQAAMNTKVAAGGGCHIAGALQSHPDGVLACLEGQWRPAMCKQRGLISKDDFGLILACDGAYWRDARLAN